MKKINIDKQDKLDGMNNKGHMLQRIGEMEAEITALRAENKRLKATGIFPKFKLGQEVWHKIFEKNEVVAMHIIDEAGTFVYFVGEYDYPCLENELFATLEEAEKALKERG